MMAGSALALAAAGPLPALAQSATRSTFAFSIPAQRVESALAAFSRATGIGIVAGTPLPEDVVSAPVSGQASAEAALRTLLAGTGLTYSFSGDTAIIRGVGEAAPVADDGSILLEEVNVTAWGEGAATGSGFQGTPDWVYETPESVSVVSRDAILNTQARNARDLVSGVAGVYSGEGNGSFPTVSPNVRGLQDSGRVVISIDGARQNAQRGLSTGASSYQSNSGQAYVDTAFIRAVEVKKTAGASAGTAGSLGGSVTFQTISADDLIAEGGNLGVEINTTRGTNEFNRQDSVLLAARLTDTPFAIVAGLSGVDLGEYRGGFVGDAAASGNFKGREGWSGLLKLEGDFGEVQTSLSWMHQHNVFKYGSDQYTNHETVDNDTLVGRITWDPADNDLVDLDARLWLNNLDNTEIRASREAVGGAPETTIELDTLSFGGAIENTSRLATPAGPLTLNYGVEAFHDDATASASSATIAVNPTWASRYIAFSPPGKRTMASAFVNGELEPAEWITLSAGLRYDWYRVQGTPTYYNRTGGLEAVTVPCDPLSNHYTAATYWPIFYAQNPHIAEALFTNVIWPNFMSSSCMAGTGTTTWVDNTTYPAHTLDIDRADGAWLPSLTAEFKPVDWFRPYVSYSHSFRPPTIVESFLVGGPPLDAVGINYAPNLALRPERARTIEIGANISQDNLLLDNDSLRLKIAAFQREVDDYIVLGDIITAEEPGRTYTSFVNLDGVTTMRGLEIEGNYDARHFWIGGSATWLDTSWPTSTEVFSNGTITTTGDIFAVAGNVPPRFKLTIDGGVRLLEEKLEVGARLTHVTPTLTRTLTADGELGELTDPYTTIDLYGSYVVNDNVTLRFAVNNVTDQRYIPGAAGYTAPGRTFLGTLNVRF